MLLKLVYAFLHYDTSVAKVVVDRDRSYNFSLVSHYSAVSKVQFMLKIVYIQCF